MLDEHLAIVEFSRCNGTIDFMLSFGYMLAKVCRAAFEESSIPVCA
jgi:hypothetical protein